MIVFNVDWWVLRYLKSWREDPPYPVLVSSLTDLPHSCQLEGWLAGRVDTVGPDW